MYKRIVPVLVVGLALWQWTALRRQRQSERQRKISLPNAQSVMRWEEAGDALPVSGSQFGPDPVSH